mmetsp:Transcript_6385/g.11675  ORF Transcript_6385/g.11675 Transcript_6385/m.11675 type:complete len:172 (-) Transcript_6385:18-533(-)
MAQLAANDLTTASREFIGLLMKPRLTRDMFMCSQQDWFKTFERWDILYFWALIAVSALFWVLRAVSELVHLQLVTIVVDVVYTLVDLLLSLLLNGTSWYCVVKRLGFCGRAGYVVWALVYLLLNVGRLQAVTRSLYYWLYLLMLIPAGYMVLSLLRLFCGAAPRTPLVSAA